MKKAFTIIELLVVISIIVVLVAIILPSFSKAQYSTKSEICKNNMRQIMLGIQMYTNNYKDLPDAFAIEPVNGNNGLSAKLRSYIETSPIPNNKISPWFCPLDDQYWKNVGNSFFYNPFTWRQNYTISPLSIVENIPLIEVLSDAKPRKGGIKHICRFDGSSVEIKQGEYRPGASWLQSYLRN